MFKQPMAGILASILVMAVSLLFISLFDFATFTGWASYALMSLIPMEIMVGVVWACNQPGFVARANQPAKGFYLVMLTILGGLVMGSLQFAIVGGGVSPPTPMLIQCTITAVIITFWLAIIMGGWPFTTLIHNPVAAGLALLVAVYVINYLLFLVFFNFEFLRGAPVYVADLDPQGLFNGWYATVFYVTCIAMMFFLLLFDLWPISRRPALMTQPRLGLVFTLVVLALGSLVFFTGVYWLEMEVVRFMVTVPIPFIFGTIIVLNMLQNSLFAGLAQPLKGVANALAALIIGVGLAWLYGLLAPLVTGELAAGPPAYEYEIWLASALLAVTFPFLICFADFFEFGGLLKKEGMGPSDADLPPDDGRTQEGVA